jgi:hypothetical protein
MHGANYIKQMCLCARHEWVLGEWRNTSTHYLTRDWMQVDGQIRSPDCLNMNKGGNEAGPLEYNISFLFLLLRIEMRFSPYASRSVDVNVRSWLRGRRSVLPHKGLS